MAAPPPSQWGAKPPAPYGAPPGPYGAPPPGGYPPPGGAPLPGYGAPGGYPSAPPPGAPYGAGYPPPGAPYGAPPPGAPYGAPPPGAPYGAKPPAGYPGPPSGAPYGAPPGAPYGAPPPGAPYGAPPPSTPYGAPPGPYGAKPPAPGGYPPYGAPPPSAPYGAPPGVPYGALPGAHYGASPGAPYGAPGYGVPAPQPWGKPAAGGWNVAADPRRNAFMSALKQNLTRDYIILVDKSGSMQGQRWHDANIALQALAGEVVRADPDGAVLVFFSTAGTLQRFPNITNAGRVNELFSTVYPGGTTDLGGALTAVLNEHFDPSRVKPGYPPGHAPTTILVITDGEPDDAGEVMRVLINASNALLADAELSVTFIQVGDDEDAARFLRSLDDGLVSKGARFDIVDTVTKEKMMGMSFADLIYKSMHD